jgi:glycosyltransferase involved in cell wall biosynthesis
MAPRVLLLVNSDPAGSGVGELFLREIGAAYPKSELVRFSTVQSRTAAGESTWLGFPSISRLVRSSSLPLLSSVFEARFASNQLQTIASEIERLLVTESIDVLWAVLSSGPLIRIVEKLALPPNVRLAVSVLDDPEYFAKNQRLDPLTRAAIMRSFERTLRKSGSISVIGESMKDIYQRQYGVSSLVMRHGIPDHHFNSWKGLPADRDLTLVFAGSLYAKKEWNSLLQALDVAAWNVGGRPIRLRFVGTPPRRGARTSDRIEYLGPKPFDEALRLVRDADVAYLPYWFSQKYALAARTSFPGKLSAYAASGIPVLFHGPESSSVTPFLQQYPFGVCCHSLESTRILAALSMLATDAGFHNRAAAAQQRAFYDELNLQTMLRRFSELVGCDATLLAHA